MEDRSWMYQRKNSVGRGMNPDFVAGVYRFLDFATTNCNPADHGEIRCPCSSCKNRKFQHKDIIISHLYRKGFVPGYKNWSCHGEPSILMYPSPERTSGNPYRDMVVDGVGRSFDVEYSTNVEEPPNAEAQKLYEMLEAVDTPIWEGCVNHSVMSIVARLLNIKSENNMSEKCFNQIVQLMKEALPSGNKLPDDFYQTKRLVSGLGLPVQKIDVCMNGCMLYWKEEMNSSVCKFCGEKRYMQRKKVGKDKQVKEVAFKKMYYFPITPRLQRLYASKATAEHMRWHLESVSEDGIMNHPRDAEAWKHFSMCYPEFAKESRNVRLGLCTDGFSPFGMSGKQYSSWPVIITPYNLPPWMCMKNEVMFLTIIVPGPRNPKQKIDVYLQPLVDELNSLWLDGVDTYDISSKQNFRMRAALHWTINDFPAYGMLSGWSTAGKMACPCCMEQTKAFALPNGRKQSWFDCHRKFLPNSHPFRRDKKSFRCDKGVELGAPPTHLTGHQLFERVHLFPKITETARELGKEDGRGEYHNWAKRSILWDLPYWKSHILRHNIDVMHNEKNVFDNLFNTVMDVNGKTKDNVKARQDLEIFCNRPELKIDRVGKDKGKKPKACYTITKDQKKILLEWVKGLRLPDAYASNLGRCVDFKELKLTGMKSHDCHVFMERFIPIVFRELLPPKIWGALTELSLFYRDLCAPKLSVAHMHKLEQEIAQLVCKLEQIFPPAFFDVMEHLIVHLPYEARVGGPVQYRWMYPFERFLHHLKIKIKNKARVEGSICNAYLVKEASTFFSYYFEPHVQTKTREAARNEESEVDLPRDDVLSICKSVGRKFGKISRRYLKDDEFITLTNYMLRNCEEVEPFVEKFKELIQSRDPTISDVDLERKFDSNFQGWFRDYANNPSNNIDARLKSIAWGPSRAVNSFHGYFINGFRFHTHSYSEGKKTENSGVCVKGGTSNDGSTDYYGILEEIIEVELPFAPPQKVVMFKCEWYDPTINKGVKIHPSYNLIDINHKRRYTNYDPFILANQAFQVYYMSYTGCKRSKSDWWNVQKCKARHVVDAPIVDHAFQADFRDGSMTDNIVVTEDVGSLSHENGENEFVDLVDTQATTSTEFIVDDEDEWESTDESNEETDIEFEESDDSDV